MKYAQRPGPPAATFELQSGLSATSLPLYNEYDLYIPAPEECNSEQSLEYHVATRNFVAWLFQKPLVGKYMSQALIALLDRINIYRPRKEKNTKDMVAYLEHQGYSDFRECVDHALGVLNFAENYELKDLWADAFAHCVGMNDRLLATTEFDFLSRVTMALITRARLEMDVRTDRANKSLSNFLEDELSAAHLGLGKHARAQLDQFRSFLQAYCVGRYGYWPPAAFESESIHRQAIYVSMYQEFRTLYEFVVDAESTNSIQDSKWASGGICVLQNISNFDNRHQYQSLPHPLPLLPRETTHVTADSTTADVSAHKKRSSSIELLLSRRAMIGSRDAQNRRKQVIIEMLENATHRRADILTNRLVKEFVWFEKSSVYTEHKISAANGRKVRWMFIYAMLQTLVSVTTVPVEVTNTKDVSYALCCKIPQHTPWWVVRTTQQVENEEAVQLEIQPDISYLTSYTAGLTMSPANTGSKHSSKLASRGPSFPSASNHSGTPRRSMRRILPRRSSSNQTVTLQKPKFCEIFVHGYGNGLNHTTDDKSIADAKSGSVGTPEPTTPVSRESSTRSTWSQSNVSDDGGFTEMDHHSIDGEIKVTRRSGRQEKTVHFVEPERSDVGIL